MTQAPFERPIRLGITVGDPAGIGPEIVARALSESDIDAEFSVYGDIEAVERESALPSEVKRHRFSSASVEPGIPQPQAAFGVVNAIQAAGQEALAGEVDALVTGPISKQIWHAANYQYPGHTELLADICAEGLPVMMLVGGSLRVALATIHCPIREVPDQLSEDGLYATLCTMHSDLEKRFRIDKPNIAVCGLNPHAGEGGSFGDEEARIIKPAVRRANKQGITVNGPYAADTLFHRAIEGEFDAVLSMYHDQGLGPLKVHAFGTAVNVTLGLPIIRTSVDHGTAFDIAGKGKANAGSMIAAIELAHTMVLNRNQS